MSCETPIGNIAAEIMADCGRNIRRTIALQLLTIRRLERNQGYSADRSGDQYLLKLQGLKYFFTYINQLKSSKTVLEIGAGSTRGISEISKLPATYGLDFIATGLQTNDQVGSYLGYSKYRITSVEILRGIEDTSIAGIIALHSIAYSAVPVAAACRIDEILVPGGIIKATFRGSNHDFAKQFCDKYKFQSPDIFKEVFLTLGYDIAQITYPEYSILLGIKSGGSVPVTAQNLLERDRKLYLKEQSLYENGFSILGKN